MLEINGVTKRYGARTALDAVSLSLASRKTHVLLGSSGSGKSTMLRAMLGLISTEQGSIHIKGTLASNMTHMQRAKTIGYVPQDGELFPHLTAEDNITLVARSMGWDRKRISERLQQLNRIIPLERGLFKSFPSELSGGQKQRMALLRSLFLDPELILLDEPFASLDPLVRAEIQTEVKSLFSHFQKTVVFVTHDVGEAHYLADNIVLMHEGRVVQQGQLDDLIDRPANAFVTKFLQAQRIFQISQGVR